MMESASSRLRHVFHYNDDGDDAPIQGVDEEEQEKIITSLENADTSSNIVFKRTIVTLALVAVIFTSLIDTSVGSNRRLLRSVLCLHTLVVALDIPVHPLGPQGLHDRRPFKFPDSVERWVTDRAFTIEMFRQYEGQLSLIGYVLCLLVIISEYASYTPDQGVHRIVTTTHIWFPVVLFALAQVAKFELRAAQTGIVELKNMRYEYKGA